ncbi:MAG: hypothetical protein KBE22_02610, partial [Candidatus Accumulibacter sp.]|nr:hypothetical protein [Accumulibacter sp.]
SARAVAVAVAGADSLISSPPACRERVPGRCEFRYIAELSKRRDEEKPSLKSGLLVRLVCARNWLARIRKRGLATVRRLPDGGRWHRQPACGAVRAGQRTVS